MKNHRLHRSVRRIGGYTLIEMLIAVAVLAVLVAAVLPSHSGIDERQRLNAAAMVLISDIEFAQIMTIANPQDPLVVRIDDNNVRYWIARASSPNDPINRVDTGQPYVVVFGAGRAETAAGVMMSLVDMPDRMLEFDTHGGLADFTTAPSIRLAQSGTTHPRVRIDIAPSTGTTTATYEPRP